MVRSGRSVQRKKVRYEGGASRSFQAERFDLIPGEGQIAAARRFGLGVEKHGEGNWKSGGVEFIKATLSHLQAHIASLLSTDQRASDSHTDAIVWAGHALAWFRVRKAREFWQAIRELRDGKVE